MTLTDENLAAKVLGSASGGGGLFYGHGYGLLGLSSLRMSTTPMCRRKWRHSPRGVHRGAAIFCRPVKPEPIERSHICDEGVALSDARHYRQLALSAAGGWDRLALHPFD